MFALAVPVGAQAIAVSAAVLGGVEGTIPVSDLSKTSRRSVVPVSAQAIAVSAAAVPVCAGMIPVRGWPFPVACRAGSRKRAGIPVSKVTFPVSDRAFPVRARAFPVANLAIALRVLHQPCRRA